MSSQSSVSKKSVDKAHWSELREAGTMLGFRFLLGVYRLFGRWVFTLFLYPAMLYFICRRKIARNASLDFLTTHWRQFPSEWTHKPGWRDVLRHFMSFGQSVLDKLLAWSSEIDHDAFVLPNPEKIDALLEDERGQLIIGSHMGNLEFCRGYMTRYREKHINILLHDKHAANFVAMMRQINPASRLNVYQVSNLDVGTVLMLKEKLQRGEWLFIAGDRVPLSGHIRTTTVSFMGRDAPLPIGPYLLAQSLGCPVRMMFSYRLQGRVHLEVEHLTDKLVLPRPEREAAIQRFAQKFADALERRVTKVPFQWFNYYDFWQLQSSPD